jgi:hypothetical protein
MDKSGKKEFSRVVFFAALWFITYFVCLIAIKKTSPDAAPGVVLSFIPVVTFGFFIYSIIKGVASMDEVQIRVQMEAVVIAFSLSLLALMTLGLLDLVITLKKEDWGYRHLFPYFTMFYFIGLIVSKRKYD